ncbi:MAG: alanine--tRNA ligase [Planctomycetota bacterium]|jgi:alanyl-tRNA synthetase
MSHTTAQPTTRTAAQIRREFIDFFTRKHGHTFVPSSPVVPHDDPTLLFANAGMNQFKDVFLAQGTRDYRRAVNSQKCIRAGGKHNDLEDVGRDDYHHTFFEMLGNWSFGDYFKAEAIAWAWSLLTDLPPQGWGLAKDRLYATVFGGNDAEGLPPDTEAEEIWKQYIDAARISRWDKKDNFWEMGEAGPCGPCSEIHYDFTPDKSGAGLVNAGDPRVIELWNLVFIQFNRGIDGTLTPLPAHGVDTGMGLERLVRILQNKQSNYDIDLFAPIFKAIENHTGAHPYRGSLDDPVDIAYRVVADHIRCLTAAITDGAWPGNEGRGYVLRRILRRAVRHAHQTLQTSGAWLYELVPTVVQTLGDAFPELEQRPDRVADVIRDEEESFLRTLDRGLELFTKAVGDAGEAGRRQISAGDAFRLHDTYGLPIDLTRVMAEERGMTVDLDGYEKLMDEARARSRQAAGEKEPMELPAEVITRLKALGTEPTRDGDKFEGRPVESAVLAIWNGCDLDDSATRDQRVGVILDRTNHYAEAGGQVGDEGTIETDGACKFEVQNTEACADYVLHIGRVTEGTLRVGDRVTVSVDRARREPIRANHTATHLLNYALRDVLGPEEDQKGSLVAPDRLRFDFSCAHAMSDDEIERTQRLVGRDIEKKIPVFGEVVPLEQARSINGVRAVFGEKYPDPVRVVSIGVRLDEVLDDPAAERWREFSIELCGGTHLGDTSEASRFMIVSEQALAAGVRRITALTGPAALAAEAAARALEQRARAAGGLDDDRLPGELDELSALLDETTIGATARAQITTLLEPLRKRAKTLRKARQAETRAGLVGEARRIAAAADGPIIVERMPGANPNDLLSAMDAIRSRHAEAAVMLIGADEQASRVSIVARVPEALISRGLKAGDWVREAATACGGRGGGRPDMAQAGAKNPQQVPEAIAAARAFAERALQ